MPAHVIGVVRGADRLEALVYELADATAQPWQRAARYERRPLDERSALLPAWRALAAVTRWDDVTLGHVRQILRDTVPGDDPGELPALVETPPPPRATAAHPRAFRGTKARPPRPRQPEVDLRPYLLTRRHTDQVLDRLGAPRLPDASFDPAFVTYLVPLLGDRELGAFATLARALELASRPDLRAALVGVTLAAPDHARGWWSHVLAHDPDHRLEIAQLVRDSGVAHHPAMPPELAAQLAPLPALHQWVIYRGLAAGASPAYVASGLALDAITPEQPNPVPPGRPDVTAIVTATIARLGEAMEEDSGPEFWRGFLWKACGHYPALVDLLDRCTALEPRAAFWLIRFTATAHWVREYVDPGWRDLAQRVTWIADHAARLPAAYQRKLVEDLCDLYDWALDLKLDVTDTLARCVGLALRVARSPFATESLSGDRLASMALLYTGPEHDADRRAIHDAPDASWLALEQALQRDNQARLLGQGLNRLAHCTPALLATTFVTHPIALFETADAIAQVSYEEAKQLLRQYAASSIAAPALADAPLETLCAELAPIAQAGGPNPIRRALRDHLAGTRPLRDAQLRGHRARIVADLGILRLAAVRQTVDRALAARVGLTAVAPEARHALAMLTHAEMQRRQLRRLITQALAGDPTWRLRHPRSQEWLALHSRVADAWLAGIELVGELPGHGPVRLAVEADPLEALKLGSYAGTCLGRGGRYAASAASIVLDVNKHVVYARDARGTIVGRQLIALSEAEQLVCFTVYGAAKTEPLFRDFDHAFAAKLGIPLLRGEAEYHIEGILAHQWWDDGPLRDP